MTPEDIITYLSARLRRQGVSFNGADLEALAAEVRQKPTIDHDIEALAQRFRDSQQAATLRRRRVRACLGAACIAGVGIMLLGIGGLFWLYQASGAPASTDPDEVSTGSAAGVSMFAAAWFLVGTGMLAAGGLLAAIAFTGVMRTSRRFMAKNEQTAAAPMSQPGGRGADDPESSGKA